jgi:hypothetical protein
MSPPTDYCFTFYLVERSVTLWPAFGADITLFSKRLGHNVTIDQTRLERSGVVAVLN